jgi:hypothetical protein
MRSIPAIFHWPTPWMWAAIGALILLNADNPFEVLRGLAGLTLVASLIFFVRNRKKAPGAAGQQAPGDMEARLDAIERRLTDTQDVMIALSEKVDDWESRSRQEKESAA